MPKPNSGTERERVSAGRSGDAPTPMPRARRTNHLPPHLRGSKRRELANSTTRER